MTRCVWDDIVGQPKAASYLRVAAETGRSTHAYLFVGPPGAGKKTAARAFACGLLCDDGGCGACASCVRVRRGAHPDVRIVQPEGAAGYLVEQVRDLVRDASLSATEGSTKVYIIEGADQFNDASANALLKTLEEPAGGVVFILLAHAVDTVIPTIASRCQIVRFRRLPPSEAIAILRESTGATAEEAKAALAAAGGVTPRARDFLDSPARRTAREAILRALKDLPAADDLDVLASARELLECVRAPLDDLKASQQADRDEQSDFLGRGAMKALEERHRRELTAREREGLAEVLNVAESWLRDCLVLSQNAPEIVVNTDTIDAMDEVAQVITPAAVVRALDAVDRSRKRISYNVSPQLAVEAMLFDVREVLRCPR